MHSMAVASSCLRPPPTQPILAPLSAPRVAATATSTAVILKNTPTTFTAPTPPPPPPPTITPLF